MFELILRAPRPNQVLVYSRFYISQNLLYSQKKKITLWVFVGFAQFMEMHMVNLKKNVKSWSISFKKTIENETHYIQWFQS